MRVFLLLLLLMPALVHAQDGDGVAVCCGRSDVGFRNNLPPLDSVRFGQQFSQPDYGLQQSPPVEREAEATYPPSFGLYNLDEGGYDPGTGRHTVRPLRPWHETDNLLEWESDKCAPAGRAR